MTSKSQYRSGSGRPNVARLRRIWAQSDPDKEDVHDSILALTDAELISFGLNAYRMNLLSLFGDVWSQDRIFATARKAAISKLWRGWEYHHYYLPRLTPTPDQQQLKKVPVDLVREQLARGRGLVIITFHQGHFRYIGTDVAHAGIQFHMPLAHDAFINYETARKVSPDAAVWTCMHVVDVEQGRGSLTLARTLAKGGCVGAVIDGNTGLDGPRGDDCLTTVKILNCKARVKNGLIKMAARFGSPILPLFAHTINGNKTCHTAPLIDPFQPLRGAEADHFVETAIGEIYALFGENLLAFADEWSGGDLFHQWRVPEPPLKRSMPDVQRALRQQFDAGKILTLNARRIIELRRDNEVIWMDAKTMRCYRMPNEMIELVDNLNVNRGGLDLEWFNRRADPERSRMWDFVCQLVSHDAIHIN